MAVWKQQQDAEVSTCERTNRYRSHSRTMDLWRRWHSVMIADWLRVSSKDRAGIRHDQLERISRLQPRRCSYVSAVQRQRAPGRHPRRHDRTGLRRREWEQLVRLVHAGPVAAAFMSGRTAAGHRERGHVRARVRSGKRGTKQCESMTPIAVRLVVFNPTDVGASGRDDRPHACSTRIPDRDCTHDFGGRVLEARFAERDRYLITLLLATSGAMADNEVVLTRHLLNPQNLIEDACARLTHNLDEASWSNTSDRNTIPTGRSNLP